MRGAVFFCIIVTVSRLDAADKVDMVSQPVVIQGSVTDEKGTKIPSAPKKPALFSVFVGNRFALPDTNGTDAARDFATSHIIRANELIYNGSGTGAEISGAAFAPGVEPALRVEWEAPFERVPFLPSWGPFSAQLSFEGGFTGTRNVASSSGNFRYQNNQPNHVALADVTYTGSLTVTEKRQNLTPMLGIGIALTNPAMQRASGLTVLVRIAGGVSLQNGQRSYSLDLAPQYISAGSYSDTYRIKSSITQSYAMAPLAAGRAELGMRLRISERFHLALVGSMTVLYGILPYDNLGSFTEQAGAEKVTFRKIIASTSDQDYLGLVPAVFLALSLEI